MLNKKVLDIITESKGDILDIGYGWGISSNYFYTKQINSLTIIEKRKDVYKKALVWAADKPNVHIYLGDWIDIIPSLDKKFDGIYMDTISPEDENFSNSKTKEEYEKLWDFYHTPISEQEWNKYKSFEDHAKTIAKENCALCIFQYTKFRTDLNKKKIQIYWGSNSGIPKMHDLGWTYFVAGEFRKEKFYESKNILTEELCNELISENKKSLTFYEAEKEIDNILHKRKFNFTELKYNSKFENILNKTIFSRFKPVNLKQVWCGFFEYNKGEGYDRHVETIKGVPISDKEQFHQIYDFTLNNGYEGGEVEIYDKWYKNDRDTFATVKPKAGECLMYKPFQHVAYKKIKNNKKYQILVAIKNSDLQKNLI